MTEREAKSILLEVTQATDDCRRVVLDTAEIALYGTQQWPQVRKQLLKAFGCNGLQSRLESALGFGPGGLFFTGEIE